MTMTPAIIKLRNRRNASDAIDAWLRGDLTDEDLNPSEVEILERVTSIVGRLKESGYDQETTLNAHAKAHLVSYSTAERDLRIANTFFLYRRAGNAEIRRAKMIARLEKALDIAEADEDAGVMARVAEVLRRLENLDGEGGGTVDAEKIKQHIYIIAVDPFSEHLLHQKGVGVAPNDLDFNLTPKEYTDYEEVGRAVISERNTETPPNGEL